MLASYIMPFSSGTGVKPSILTLQWPAGVNPAEPKQFETRARSLRMQTLGRVCHQRGVGSLLFAHHEDDNHELLIQRLALSSRYPGLCGMSPNAHLPHCEGMHGVSRSGSFTPDPSVSGDSVQGFEQGGIRVLRPLLSFSKARLVATCQAAALSWLEDPTNADVTLTARNAIRKTIAQGSLPRALQKPALLQTAQVCRTKIHDVDALSEELYRACAIDIFDVHAGFLALRIPRPAMVFGADYETAWSRGLKKAVLVVFLRNIAEMITPRSRLETRSFKEPARIVFGLDHDGRERSFTAGDVTFWRAEAAVPPDKTFERWTAQRAVSAGISRHATEVEVLPGSPAEFRLWDGRFWIRVQNVSSHPLVLKPATPEALKTFSNHFSTTKRWLTLLLRQITSGKAKTTILTIQLPNTTDDVRRGQIVSLPTLGLTLPGYHDKVAAEIHYKNLDVSKNFMALGDFKAIRYEYQGSALSDPALYYYRRDSNLPGLNRPGHVKS